ncbi:hypothetical protein L1887_38729 [Cichorium endivia]|nr:hypothetical protein L1887_38729 [Cichorium endivia]
MTWKRVISFIVGIGGLGITVVVVDEDSQDKEEGSGDLHMQYEKHGVRIQKDHIESGVTFGSLSHLRVITGHGENRSAPSGLRQALKMSKCLL